jgi:hypothetical protein
MPPRFFFPWETCHIFASIFVSIVGMFFGTWFLPMVFLFMVNKLGLLTNLGHWVRVLYFSRSYMYIVL